MKQFDAGRGVQLDQNFLTHSASCDRCRMFDESRPATAAHMCLEGSVLWKRDNLTTTPKPKVERSEHYASKTQVKRLMRYKGE